MTIPPHSPPAPLSNQRLKLSWRGGRSNKEQMDLDGGRRTTQLMRDSLGVAGGSVRSLAVLSLVILCLPPKGRAQTLPPFVGQGLDLLVRGQPDSAVNTWTSAWVTPEDIAKRTQLVDAFKRLPQFAGQLLGYDLIRVIDITPHLRRAYFLLRCQRQPAYLLMVIYQPRNDWVLTTVNWHTDADHVLSEGLFGLEHPKP